MGRKKSEWDKIERKLKVANIDFMTSISQFSPYELQIIERAFLALKACANQDKKQCQIETSRTLALAGVENNDSVGTINRIIKKAGRYVEVFDYLAGAKKEEK